MTFARHKKNIVFYSRVIAITRSLNHILLFYTMKKMLTLDSQY
jgi:hypothetical protein